MKTLFKLVVALLVLNAAARGAWSMWTYSQFKEAAQQVVLFGQKATPEELEGGILAKATELHLPVRASDIVVTRDTVRTVAEASYTQPVEFFPNYAYPVKFSFQVDAVSFNGPGPSRQTQ
jgi:hypothetical protein